MSEKSKLLWRCRRGVKELDVLFTRFVESTYDDLPESDQAAFNKLLEVEDPEILGYILYDDKPTDPDVAAIVAKILSQV